MNYIEIRKAAALFLVSASFLSATIIDNMSTEEKAKRIHKKFDLLERKAKEETITLTPLKATAADLKNDIIKLINSDNNIINQTDTSTEGFNEAILIRAVYNRFIEIINILLTREVDVNAKDKDGFTALMHAAMQFDFKIVKLLLTHKAVASMKDNKKRTALDLAKICADNNPDNNHKTKTIGYLKAAEDKSSSSEFMDATSPSTNTSSIPNNYGLEFETKNDEEGLHKSKYKGRLSIASENDLVQPNIQNIVESQENLNFNTNNCTKVETWNLLSTRKVLLLLLTVLLLTLITGSIYYDTLKKITGIQVMSSAE